MHLLHGMNVTLDFINMGPVELRGARKKIQNEKLWHTVRFEPTTGTVPSLRVFFLISISQISIDVE